MFFANILSNIIIVKFKTIISYFVLVFVERHTSFFSKKDMVGLLQTKLTLCFMTASIKEEKMGQSSKGANPVSFLSGEETEFCRFPFFV